MTIMVEEQQKRSERARIKAYYARRRRKRLQKTLKQKPSGFKDMRLTNKSDGAPNEKNYPRPKITKLPPGEALGARDLQRWGKLRRYGSYGRGVGRKNWVCRNGHQTKTLRTVTLERCPKCNVL
jgi:hypothetical protein